MKKKIILGAMTFLAALSLVACKGQGDAKGSSESTTDSSSAAQTLTDADGHTVTVPANPQRVIASYLEDYVLALGVTPVAQWTVGGGSIQNYLQDKLADIPTISYDLPYEDVLSFTPDLLLVSSSGLVEGGKYDEYSKIAPTYVVKNGDGVTWEEQLTDVAKVLGKVDAGEKVLKEYQDDVAATKKELAAKIEGKSAAVLWVTNNTAFMVRSDRSSGRLLYQDLGFEVPALVADVTAKATSDWSQVSLESLSQLDADYLFLVNSDTGAAMFKESLWENIPAVKNQQLHEFSPEKSWLYNGPIAYTEMLADIADVLK